MSMFDGKTYKIGTEGSGVGSGSGTVAKVVLCTLRTHHHHIA
jgi:hypothetical protein